MAEFTPKEAAGQAVKACRYFGRVLDQNNRGVIAVQVDDTTFVVAHGKQSDRLTGLIEAQGWKVDVPSDEQQKEAVA